MGRWILKGFLVFAFCMAGAHALAQENTTAAPSPPGEAMPELKKMADFLASAKQFGVVIHSLYDVVQESGQKLEFGEVRRLTLARPDRLRVENVRSDGAKSLVIFNGKEITDFNEKDNSYAAIPQPGDIDASVIYFVRDLHMRLPLAMMLLTSLPSEIGQRVTSAAEVESTVTTDVPCTHIAARTERVDFQVWIPKAGDPLPRRVVITYKNEPGQPQFQADFSQWNLSPNISDSEFTFTPPQGAERIQFLAEVQKDQPVSQPNTKGGKE